MPQTPVMPYNFEVAADPTSGQPIEGLSDSDHTSNNQEQSSEDSSGSDSSTLQEDIDNLELELFLAGIPVPREIIADENRLFQYLDNLQSQLINEQAARENGEDTEMPDYDHSGSAADGEYDDSQEDREDQDQEQEQEPYDEDYEGSDLDCETPEEERSWVVERIRVYNGPSRQERQRIPGSHYPPCHFEKTFDRLSKRLEKAVRVLDRVWKALTPVEKRVFSQARQDYLRTREDFDWYCDLADRERTEGIVRCWTEWHARERRFRYLLQHLRGQVQEGLRMAVREFIPIIIEDR